MLKTALAVVFFMALITGQTIGQDSISYAGLIPKSIVKYSPLHLLNHYPTIQLAYEQGLGGKWTAQIDVGYVINYDNIDSDFEDKRGFKLKVEPRYYFADKIEKHVLFYLAVEYYINRINFDRSERREECFDVTCNHRYMRTYDFEVKYREMGSTFKFGKLKWYGDIALDFNFGLSLRYIRYHHPPGSLPLDGWFRFINEEDRTAFSPYISGRIGYRLK